MESRDGSRASLPGRKVLHILLVGALLALVTLAVIEVVRDSVENWDLNLVRLYRTSAFSAGTPLYPAPGTGVSLLTLYPPLGALAYLPATWPATPTAGILVGIALSILFIFVPVALLLSVRLSAGSGARSPDPRGGPTYWLLLVAFLAMAIDLRPLEYVMFSIHVDAPTLGLAMLSCVALLASRGRGVLFAGAALGVVLTLWTKQVALFLVPALPLYLWLDRGPRTALRFLFWVIGFGLPSLIIISFFFGSPELLWRHLVVLPSLHPWQFGGGASAWLEGTRLAALSLLPAMAIGIASLLPFFRASRRNRSAPATRSIRGHSGTAARLEPWLLLWLVALLAIPTSILARVKEGGDINSFSFSIYFLIAGAILALRDHLVAGTGEAHPSAASLRLAKLVLAVFLSSSLLPVLFLQEPGSLRPWRPRTPWADLPHEMAYRYARAHPGEVYFPRMAAVSYLAEGAIYHNGPSLIDLHRANIALSEEWLRSHLPANLQRVAYFRNGFQMDVEWLPLPGLEPAPDEPELPGFQLYSLSP